MARANGRTARHSSRRLGTIWFVDPRSSTGNASWVSMAITGLTETAHTHPGEPGGSIASATWGASGTERIASRASPPHRGAPDEAEPTLVEAVIFLRTAVGSPRIGDHRPREVCHGSPLRERWRASKDGSHCGCAPRSAGPPRLVGGATVQVEDRSDVVDESGLVRLETAEHRRVARLSRVLARGPKASAEWPCPSASKLLDMIEDCEAASLAAHPPRWNGFRPLRPAGEPAGPVRIAPVARRVVADEFADHARIAGTGLSPRGPE